MLSCLMDVDLNYGQEIVSRALWWSFLAIILCENPTTVQGLLLQTLCLIKGKLLLCGSTCSYVYLDVCSKWLPHVYPQLPLLLTFLNYELWTTNYSHNIHVQGYPTGIYKANSNIFTCVWNIIYIFLTHTFLLVFETCWFFLIKQCVHWGLIKIAQQTSNLHHFTPRTHPSQSISARSR